MEALSHFSETEHTWIFLIGVVIVVFLAMSLLKTLFKFAIVFLVISIAATLLFNMSPNQLVDSGRESLKMGTEFVQDKMISLLSEGYLTELFESDFLTDFIEDFEDESDTIADLLEQEKK
ncbi:hypothetical protein JCM9140_4512 [Halalkalibacter wakoensis JCM 9140]|uniref:Uncharacterized protein n=1 Tax=Halalkalibacter wakoensis JCM 9140 TaxID=1236970 RepID=W4Q8I8_9BACI|nr:hypothetical protein [Halalkalibacter wakoensis]GAE28297.1 hypothetical protein JCM9140_4512 [Halalkalibacter wakoensis JCM 9140]